MLHKHPPLLRPFWAEAIHIFALCALAVAQPIYNQLAGGPGFLVAHQAGALEIAGLVAALSIGLPLALIALEAGIGLISLTARRALHLLFVWGLIGTFVLQAINRFFAEMWVLPIVIAVLLALIVTLLYTRSLLLGRVATIMAIGAIVFPAHFLFFTPVTKIVMQIGAERTLPAPAITTDIPVVLVVLDEFNPMALLNEKREIDAVRFPNFAKLAQNAWWYPRATSVHPQTLHAVPAILTGRFPENEKRLPSYRGHPNNLFTLLSGSYSFNVVETLTSMCPDKICGVDAKQFEIATFASDLAVIYQYTIMPRALASEVLPPLDNGWKGFGDEPPALLGVDTTAAAPNPEQELVDDFAKIKFGTRPSTFRSFIAKAGAGNRHLDFIHILLPHAPYQFLPDGTMYDGSAADGMLNGIWLNDQYLVNVGYQRYLMQVGLVDTLIGELVARLKTTGVYDRALIIVTADHGKIFRTATSARELTEEIPDVLHIPLFIKRPGQKEGGVDQRLASNIDVVPTIADILGIKIPWSVDGQSVFDTSRTETSRLDVRFRGRVMKFDRNEIAALPQFDWQIKTFGSGTPLNALSIRGPHSDLVGRDVRDLKLGGSGREAPSLQSTDLQLFANVHTTSGYLPALFRGKIEGAPILEQRWVALALNGKIVVVTPTYNNTGEESSLLTLIPQSAFVDGANSVTAYFVEISENGPRLLPIRVPVSETFTLSKNDDGSEALLSSTGERTPIIVGQQFGYVDEIATDTTTATLGGWSADVANKTPVRLMVVFIDDKFAYSIIPDGERHDLVEAFGSEKLLNSGYSIKIPLQSKGAAAASFRVFGISQAGVAGELGMPKTPTAATTNPETFTLSTDDDGSEALQSSEGTKTSIIAGRRFGYVDRLVTDAAMAKLEGWSADVTSKTPVQLVVVFINGKFAYSVAPFDARPDVAKAYGSEKLANSGYSMTVPLAGKDASDASFRVFGISQAGVAGELEMPKAPANTAPSPERR